MTTITVIDERDVELPLGKTRHFTIRLSDDTPASVIVGRDNVGTEQAPDYRWFVFANGVDRVPSWRELAAIAHTVRPGVPFVLGIPPESRWVDLLDTGLMAWETKDANLLDEWRRQHEGAKAS